MDNNDIDDRIIEISGTYIAHFVLSEFYFREK